MKYTKHSGSVETLQRNELYSRSTWPIVIASLLAFLLIFFAFSSPARAVIVRSEIATFGPDGTSTSSFGRNHAIAIRQATRDLYVIDQEAPGIFGFDISAPPAFPTLTGFTPLSTPETGAIPGVAIDNTNLASAGNIYLISEGTKSVYGFDSAGAPLGGNFPIEPAINPGPPAGSPTDICGGAVDPTGNLWVANFSTRKIIEYNSAGVFQTAIDVSAQSLNPCYVSFDSNGDMYVTGGNGVNDPTWKYTAASGYSTAKAIELTQAGGRGSALDTFTHNLFVAHSADISERDGEGNLITQFAIGVPGFSAPIPDADFRGVAVDSSNNYVYVSDGGGGKIRVYGPPFTLPDLTIGTGSSLTNTTAALDGMVGAQGVSLTGCHFDFVTEAAFRVTGFSDLDSGGSQPCNPPAGSIPADFSAHPVGAVATGLVANTNYRFRLAASTAGGSIATADVAFRTPGPPIVETTGSPIRTTTTARLDSRVDPSGSATTYHFEYGDEGPCDANPCTETEPQPAGAGAVTKLVSQQVGGLHPATTYHYRVVADNGNPAGAAFGSDMTVATRASDAPLTHGRLPGPPGSDRAYEQISTPDTGGNPTEGGLAFSSDGNRVMYRIAGGTPISNSGTVLSQFFAERTPSGWQTTSIDPPRDEQTGPNWGPALGPKDLSSFLIRNYSITTGRSDLWRLYPHAPPTKLFQSSASRSFSGFYIGADESSRALAFLEGEELDPAYPEAQTKKNLYDVSSGTPKLVSIMPDGTVPACGVEGSLPINATKPLEHWLSADGSRAFFPTTGNLCGGQSQLYMRELDAGQTKLISGPPVSGPACAAGFIKSTPDAVFFATKSRLDPVDTVSDDGCSDSTTDADIYRYDFGDGTLRCVTCVVPGLDADVDVHYIGNASPQLSVAVAEDGSRVYFMSPHSLVPGAGSEEGKSAYRINVASGEIQWVGAGVPVGSFANAGGDPIDAFTPDGSVFVFRSASPSMNPIGGGSGNGGTSQYYLYNDHDRSLACVSCPQDGSLPRAEVSRRLLGEVFGSFQEGQNLTPIDDKGDLAFTSPTALVSADQNTTAIGHDPDAGTDVYEWRDGRVMLVTDGLSNWPGESARPEVGGFSPSGRDLFFTAAAQYTADALDGNKRLYDARIGGGFEFPVPPPPCPLEVCQGTPKGAPEELPPGTGAFSGASNLTAPSGHRRRHKKRQPKKHHHKRAQHRTNHNRGASR